MDCNFYKPIYNITADAGIEVEAKTVEDLICKSVLATVCEMALPKSANKTVEKILEVDSLGFPYTFADIINKVIFLFEVEKFIPLDCSVLQLTPDGSFVKLKLVGNRIDGDNFEPRLLIKAATYHGLEFEKENGKYKLRVIFDI
jgi:SHS2 domain-containing protein